jgi:hypothetical protein
MRLKTFDALLKSQFAPRFFLKSELKSRVRNGPPYFTEFYKALLALVDGEGLVELTGMPSQGTFDDPSKSVGGQFIYSSQARREVP